MKILLGIVFGLLLTTAIFRMWDTPSPYVNTAIAHDHVHTNGTLKPVEKSMHEFMEYVFQPTYRRLKVSMATEPADKKGWKAIKADSLVLAESCNLLLIRIPKEDGKAWAGYAQSTRELGGKLYHAARKKDYAAAQSNYKAMLTQCNACHKKFDNGKHQLTP